MSILVTTQIESPEPFASQSWKQQNVLGLLDTVLLIVCMVLLEKIMPVAFKRHSNMIEESRYEKRFQST